MPRPPIDWLITDTHWNHDRLIRDGLRPADWAERLAGNLRHLVMPQDRLFHLGDVIVHRVQMLSRYMDEVQCSAKVLILGNHDSKTTNWYSRNGFSFVCDMVVVGDVLLSHRPVQVLPSGVRINVHGHWHQNDHADMLPWYDRTKYRRLSLELAKYRPVTIQEFAGHRQMSHRFFSGPNGVADEPQQVTED